MPSQKTPSAWQQRRDRIRSANLKPIADQINRRRLDELNRKLGAEPPLSDVEREQIRLGQRGPVNPARWQRRRLLLLVERQGLLTELPSDLRADPERMRAALLAFNTLIGESKGWRLSERRIAEEMGLRERGRRTQARDDRHRTVRRVILDLKDACLLAIVGRSGGANHYQLIESNLRADSTEFQPSLFDEREAEAAARSGESSASHRDRGGGERELLGHGGPTPGHGGPVAHRVASRPAGAPARASSTTSTTSSSSSSRGEGEEELDLLEDERWRAAYGLLRRYPPNGMTASAKCLVAARRRGWTAEQVLELLQPACDETIDGVPPWVVGAIRWQLLNADAGAPLTIPRDSKWMALRARESVAVAERARQLREAAELRDQANGFETARGELESLHGAELDRLSEAELLDVAQAAGPFVLKRVRTLLPNTRPAECGGVRFALLKVLAQREVMQ